MNYLIAGTLIALALFLVGVVLVWFAGLAAAVWWAIRYVGRVISGEGEE